MKEKLLEMLQMQQSLNERILKEHGTEKCTDDNLYYALLDEIGELNHELKAEWCWWKKTQSAINYGRVLEEYIDCIHFGLCMLLKDPDYYQKLDSIVYAYEHFKVRNKSYKQYINAALHCLFSYDRRFISLLLVGKVLGFNFDTVYKAYINKNKTNLERQENGY